LGHTAYIYTLLCIYEFSQITLVIVCDVHRLRFNILYHFKYRYWSRP